MPKKVVVRRRRESEAEPDQPQSDDHPETEDEDQLNLAMADLTYELLVQADKQTKKIEKPKFKPVETKTKVGLKTRKRSESEGSNHSGGAPKSRDMRVPVKMEKQVFQSRKAKGYDPRFITQEMTDWEKKHYYDNYEFLSRLKQHENSDKAKTLRKERKKHIYKENPDLLQPLRDEIGDNKAFVKQFSKESQKVKMLYELKDTAKQQGVQLHPLELKKMLKTKVQELHVSKNKQAHQDARSRREGRQN